MKYTLLILTLITHMLYANETDDSLIIKEPFNAELFDITQDYDRSISTVGFSTKHKKQYSSSEPYSDAFDYLQSVSSSHGVQMHLVKVDDSTNISLSKNVNLPKFSKAVSVLKTPSNGYFIGGYTLDGSLLFLKLDANANIMFSKSYGTKNQNKLTSLTLLNDGGVLAVGYSTTSRFKHDNIFEMGLGKNDIYLTRFSKNGNKIWSKKYGTQEDDKGVDAIQAEDGSIIAVSTTTKGNRTLIDLMRLSENGDKIWMKNYNAIAQTDNKIIPHRLIKLKDNNFLLLLSQFNEMNQEHIRLVKFDINQNILIDKEIFTTYPSALNDIKQFSDGTFIAVGYVRDAYNTDGLAMSLDSNLVQLNQEHYGGENYDAFSSLAILHNSQVAVAGSHTDENSQESNMWIVKLNKDASSAKKASSTSSLYQKLVSIFKEEIITSKLIINEDLSIELIDKSLYFSVAKHKLSEQQKLFLDTFTKKLIPLLYKYKETIVALEINGHTSSEWKDSDFSSTYLKNSKLSLNRAYATLSYIFNSQSSPTQEWLTKMLKGSALSYSKKVLYNDVENREKSRRVSFKIYTKE
ncbi:hypothetical protein GJV85_10450 [Sulfurimonas aquatica]|uniref:OmpA-like domain-containing protein n=1 Tax=Sulfurimonas aquatica TaxID=2672570 RepID=A0A975B1Q9_9BACT|nr:hypothetical protein [Sulfurimonas aquatica]QSZ42513.1 hypothetical protein GJV85_10450 [Sulfurimonas aquatica]